MAGEYKSKKEKEKKKRRRKGKNSDWEGKNRDWEVRLKKKTTFFKFIIKQLKTQYKLTLNCLNYVSRHYKYRTVF